jgi:hypothetical protein
LLQHNLPYVYQDVTVQGIVWIQCTLLYGDCVWGQQGPGGQRLGGGESKDYVGSEGELADGSEPEEDLCRSTKSQAQF